MESSNTSLSNFPDDDMIDILEITDTKGPKTFTKVVIFMKYLLSNRYETAQKYIFSILGAFFDKLDNSCSEQLTDLISALIETKSQRPQNVWFICMGKFLQKMNPEIILKHSPLRILECDLKLENYEDLSNSWLLPLFKKHLTVDSIRLFMEYFMPITNKLYQIFGTKMKEEFTDADKTYQILWTQIWEIFPKFCKFTKENFNYIPEIFAMAHENIANQEEIRKYVCQGLENLARYFVALPKFTTPEYIQIHRVLRENVDKLGPLLCKTYISKRVGAKNVLSLLKAISKICSQEYLERIYLKNIQRLIEDKAANKLISRILLATKEADLILSISGSLELKGSKYDIAIKFTKTFLGENNIFQKKAYKMLNVIITKVHESFLAGMLEILNEYKVVTAGARGARLNCIHDIIQKIEFTPTKIGDIFLVLQKFLPEILVALKESNKKARKGSLDVLKMVTNKMKEAGYIKQFINLVIIIIFLQIKLISDYWMLCLKDIINEISSCFWACNHYKRIKNRDRYNLSDLFWDISRYIFPIYLIG